MINDFTQATIGKTGLRAFRLGLSATYRPGEDVIRQAIDAGVNYFFLYGIDGQMIRVLRDVLRRDREKYVVATGAYNYIWWRQNFRKALDKRLRQLNTDYLDIFQFMGVMKPKEFDGRARDELQTVRADGRVRAVAISTHHRRLARELADRREVDALMVRYNAAHRGAEEEIFPFTARSGTGVISYTATRWTYLLRPPRDWPPDGRVPTAGECYRFVLTNPHVDVALSAPSNAKQLAENLAAVRQGPLSEDDMRFMREFGDAVHRMKKWFM